MQIGTINNDKHKLCIYKSPWFQGRNKDEFGRCCKRYLCVSFRLPKNSTFSPMATNAATPTKPLGHMCSRVCLTSTEAMHFIFNSPSAKFICAKSRGRHGTASRIWLYRSSQQNRALCIYKKEVSQR